ncbi:hypothetical protein [Okeania sp. SIO2B3]|uniref:hypothetical protein n=1 Tax=Okeania sp. SIO2B3 TaxID=2607784 RepID=UPI0013BFD9C4|nr:hypothetical protein [Okeania sp. SIO2B3]NET43227.1 hypothetical protein [Okeania sp. SIO2B3]
MGNKDSLLRKALKPTLYKKHWINLVEYASIVGSAVGAFAVAVGSHTFYAVAPLTLALSLNVANRYRFERQMQLSQQSEMVEVQKSVEKLEKNAVKVIVKLRQQLSTDIESVRETLSNQSIQGVNSEIQQQLIALESSVSSVQQSLASVDTKALNTNDWQTVNGRLLVIEEAIANLQRDMEALAKEPQSQISQLQAKIEDLEIQNTEVVKPHLKRLITLVRQLQHTSYSNSSSHQSVISKQQFRERNSESVKQPEGRF